MTLVLYYGSGSPYGWRVWAALEHKRLAYDLKTISFDAGDLKSDWYRALNPRGRTPVLTDGAYALYESSAILEYLEDCHPEPDLFAHEPQLRGTIRRMVREADQYFAEPMEQLVDIILFTPEETWDSAAIATARAKIATELARWEAALTGAFLAGPLSAADLTLYPMLALVRRMARRCSELAPDEITGPHLSAWAARMEALEIIQKTWPPHWR